MEIPNRGEREASLARALGKANRQALDIVVAAMQEGRNDDALWEEIGGLFRPVLQSALEQAFFDQVVAVGEAVGPGFDTALINLEAEAWARNYTYTLVKDLTDARRPLLQNAIGDFFSEQMDLRALRDRLARSFDPVRAQQIAVTEVTRAATEGERAAQKRLADMGVQTVAIWVSEQDGAVCPLCAPLNGKREGDGWIGGPPAHVNCRCWIRTEVVTL